MGFKGPQVQILPSRPRLDNNASHLWVAGFFLVFQDDGNSESRIALWIGWLLNFLFQIAL